MKTSYVKDNTRYTFHTGDAGTDNFITLAISAVNLEWEKVVQIPVREAHGFAIKVNKKSLSAECGAYGAFRFIRKCINEDFCMVYVNKIIENFGRE